jgi:hypothetical protein
VSQGPYDPQQEGQGYGQQPTPPPGQYGYGQPAQPPVGPHGYGQDVDTGATLALILSIVGLVVCQPLNIVSLIMSNNAARKVQETGKYQSQVKAAKIISIVGIVLMAIAIVVTVIVIVGAAISTSSANS